MALKDYTSVFTSPPPHKIWLGADKTQNEAAAFLSLGTAEKGRCDCIRVGRDEQGKEKALLNLQHLIFLSSYTLNITNLKMVKLLSLRWSPAIFPLAYHIQTRLH
jgi:hypothetical protein